MSSEPAANAVSTAPESYRAGLNHRSTDPTHSQNSRSAWFVPLALLEGEDDALMDVAAFQLAVGLGGLLHGHGCVRAQAEPAIGEQGDRFIQGTGSTVRRGLGERDAVVSGGGVGQGNDPARRITSGARTASSP